MMAQAQAQISLNVKEIYDILCPQCKKKFRELIKEKITDSMVESVLQDKGKA
jgi:protein-disulfide isomerase